MFVAKVTKGLCKVKVTCTWFSFHYYVYYKGHKADVQSLGYLVVLLDVYG